MASAAEFLFLLGDDDREALGGIGRRVAADRPDVLLARGDAADRVLVLESGRVKVTVPTTAGTDAVLTFRGPGALLGEQALVDELPRSADVTAVEPVTLLVISASAFRAFLRDRPSVALAMLAMLSSRPRTRSAGCARGWPSCATPTAWRPAAAACASPCRSARRTSRVGPAPRS